MERLIVCIQSKCNRPHLRKHYCQLQCKVLGIPAQFLLLLLAMHLHTGHYCELDQETDLAFQSITTKNYLSFPALFFFLKAGWFPWYRSQYSSKNSCQQNGEGRAVHCGHSHRNTTMEKYLRSEITQRLCVEPWPLAILSCSKHPTLNRLGKWWKWKGLLCGFFLLLYHAGAFYSQSSTHQEMAFCFLCEKQLCTYFSL